MDDGVELNFAAPAGSVVKRQLAPKKGGRWTDRVKAKQAVRRVIKKYDNGSTGGGSTGRSTVTAPPKVVEVVTVPPKSAQTSRPAVSRPAPMTGRSPAAPLPAVASPARNRPAPSSEAGPSRFPMATAAATSVPAQKASGGAGSAATAPTAGSSKQQAGPLVISSLFTANPSLPSVKAGASKPVLGAPSNAPLVGDTSTFAGLGLDPLLVRHLEGKMGIERPTGIQKSCLPYMISSPLDINARADGHDEDEDEDEDEGRDNKAAVSTGEDETLRDVFIQSQTGSGKTLAYLLPIIQTLLPLSRLSYIDRSIGTLAIVLAPTRELAQQISKVLESILTMALSLPTTTENGEAGVDDDRGFTRWLVSGLLVGGSTRTHEKARLRKGVPILVSTPGRLLDHLQNTSSFKCAKTLFFVLDEADRLMDLGFEETIQGILKALDGRRRNEINAEKEMDKEGGGLMRWPYWSRGRRTVLCSATVDAKVERLSGMALRDPVVFRSNDAPKLAVATAKGKGKAGTGTTVTATGPPPTDAEAVALALKEAAAITLPSASDDKFTPPSQLAQKYIVTPTKLRLVTLVALLRSLVSSGSPAVVQGSKDGTKVIVFLSSTDSVDYHWKLLGGVNMGGEAQEEEDDDDDDDEDEDGDDGKESADDDDEDDDTSKVERKTKSTATSNAKTKAKPKSQAEDLITLNSPLFPNTAIQRLHGSLPLRTRLASLKAFATASAHPSILLATSVASRGLDLPLVRAVVQYDLPTEGGANEYVHRVGRTARAGKGGEAWAFVAPAESEWVPWVEEKMGAATESGSVAGTGTVRLAQVGVDEVLKRGFGGRGHEYEARATEVQLAFERWVIADNQSSSLARKAFASFVRSYSTHPLEERRFFHVKSIHLGHLAKSFALREAPGALASKPAKSKLASSASSTRNKRKRGGGGDGSDEDDDDDDEDDEPAKKGGKETTARNETERRMYEAVRRQGRLVKSAGTLGAFATKKRGGGPGTAGGSGVGGGRGSGGGGGEFQVVGAGDLERLVAKSRQR